jgi:hypothetical protein
MRNDSISTSIKKSALLVSLLAASLVTTWTHAESGESTLEERLSATQFKAFGLDKLTAEELQALNAWLQGRGAIDKAGNEPRRTRDGYIPDDIERVAVKANIVGTFTGWGGSTVFKLDNGQEWRQTEPGSYSAQPATDVGVTIKPKSFGSWLLVLDKCASCRVSVKRIK